MDLSSRQCPCTQTGLSNRLWEETSHSRTLHNPPQLGPYYFFFPHWKETHSHCNTVQRSYNETTLKKTTSGSRYVYSYKSKQIERCRSSDEKIIAFYDVSFVLFLFCYCFVSFISFSCFALVLCVCCVSLVVFFFPLFVSFCLFCLLCFALLSLFCLFI